MPDHTLDEVPSTPSGAAGVTPRFRGTPGAGSLTGAAWLAVTLMLMSGLAPLMIIDAVPLSPSGDPRWYWSWILTALVGVRYAWLTALGAPRLFELVFWLFTYVFLGLAPMVQMRSGIYPQTTPHLESLLNGQAIAVVYVGAGAFGMGVFLAAISKRKPRAAVSVPSVNRTRTTVLAVVALLICGVYVARLGVGNLFTTRFDRNMAEAAQYPNSTVLALVKAATSLPLIVAFAALVQARRRQRNRGLVLLPWIVLIVALISMNPITSPRYVAGTAILAVITALGMASSPRRMRIFALSLAVGLVLVFPFADTGRRPADQQEVDSATGPIGALTSGDFDAFDQINNSLLYVQTEGATGGRQLTGAALFFVPRVFWPNKPEDTGIFLAEYRNYKFTNLSAPLWAEFVIDGGWALLGLGMLALGFVIRRVDDAATQALKVTGQLSVFGAVLPFYLIIVLRGSLLQAMAGLTVLSVCGWWVRSREVQVVLGRRRTAAPAAVATAP